MPPQADRGWPRPAAPIGSVRLQFAPPPGCKSLRNVSASSRSGSTLFIAADENAAIERLTPLGGVEAWGNHLRIPLRDLLDLADPEEEADLEGLAVDDGWLWVIGSHARTRPKVEKAPGERIDLHSLANLKDTRARCLLARLPLVDSGGALLPVKRDGKRRAGLLKQGKHGGALAKALKHDPLLGPFTRIPAKEGGVDIEGLAVSGERVALGMRGPVIAGHALLLEARIMAQPSGRLKLACPPVKRLLALEGLAIRDLKKCGDDLLILAGPTTALSGPCALYRWAGWADDPPQHEWEVRLHRPERLLDLPFGRGRDHPEGLALWPDEHELESRILVVHDSPDRSRLEDDGRTLLADLYQL